MLFNSLEFIIVFLPVTVIIFYMLIGLDSSLMAKVSLLVASVLFYTYWDYRFLPILALSVIFNYYSGLILSRYKRRAILVGAILFNLILLGYFKYSDFFIETLNQLFSVKIELLNHILPLAISFFSFTQIAFLVDSYKGTLTKGYNFIDYILFVTFFPHLIAGPIVYHSDIVPQFLNRKNYKVNYENLGRGLILFVIGLFKKVIIADTLAKWATPGFVGTVPLGLVEAWCTALSYTFQLYFDFSGYSDMAVALAYFFNIKLPYNFLSPYKAKNMIEFWQRWHITLSNFLKCYLYIPMGGNRKGLSRKYINLFITMTLGGLWHGAGWTFVIWGVLHGLYLIINHMFRDIVSRLGLAWNVNLGRLLTFICVVIAWVFFRSSNFTGALHILSGMLGLNGLGGEIQTLPGGAVELFVLILLYFWVNCAPNTKEISEKIKPNLAVVLVVVIAFVMPVISIIVSTEVREFLYFQF